MHAVNLITPGMMVTMIVGVIAFMVIYRMMFPKNKR
jgi:hypothetical protein